VPSLWHIEIANGLGIAERRNRLSQTAMQEAMVLLTGLPLVIDEMAPAHAFGAVLDLMWVHRLTAYDAVIWNSRSGAACRLRPMIGSCSGLPTQSASRC
jgi:predicted nucleic acid-binding protein